MEITLGSEVRFLRGVGEQRMKKYQKLGITTVEDLLRHLPRDYTDLRRAVSIGAAALGERQVVRAILGKKESEHQLRRGLTVQKLLALDGSDTITLTFFNGKYTVAALREGEEYLFYGRVDGSLTRKEMVSPVVYPGDTGGLFPVYPLTAGLTSRGIAKDAATALASLAEIPDPLPDGIRRENSLCTLDYALRTIHSPSSPEEVQIARERLVFDELLALSISFMEMKRGRLGERTQPMEPVEMAPFYAALPFSLTGAQRRAIGEAVTDLCSGTPMNRLVQGDVGSGKTMVAAACCWFAWKNGRQSALMAPTEILAEQHYRGLSPLLEGLGMRVGLLTGSSTAKEKRERKAALKEGELDLIIGTHALITGDTAFRDLGLVVTDEQHRFGVAQRMTLSGKNQGTHVLVMSATPIPRTLGLILYGDLELSVIDELPPGRQKIATYYIGGDKRQRAFGYIKKHLDMGYQGYIVCPLVEEDETGEGPPGLKAAVTYLEELERGPFAGYRLGLLHGKLKGKEKEAVMGAFAGGKIQLLVSTTVIEVGVDVPNAVIILIENAERFGLSQLHQLRGRVGRGKVQSCCILLSDARGEGARERLKYLASTGDGFQIAEYDLRTRGPGDFFGMRQHGLPQLQVADLAADGQVLYRAQHTAGRLLEEDPGLETVPELSARVKQMTGMVSGGM
ncbi:MAG: ATP-dependent DNA helicase RecG [Angelakisella sp.]|jgi:ATP-dependent DNA helicase RecG|nr:ATP-dependent DNA helicase RecG [Angelakisella sp.]